MQVCSRQMINGSYNGVYASVGFVGRSLAATSCLSTGEDMEQLFSFLSQFNLTTKNMSAAGISVLFDIPSIVYMYLYLKLNPVYCRLRRAAYCAAIFWIEQKVEGLTTICSTRG